MRHRRPPLLSVYLGGAAGEDLASMLRAAGMRVTNSVGEPGRPAADVAVIDLRKADPLRSPVAVAGLPSLAIVDPAGDPGLAEDGFEDLLTSPIADNDLIHRVSLLGRLRFNQERDLATREENAELLGLLTHDLRNPLAALTANLSYLKAVAGDGVFNDEIVQVIGEMQLSTAFLLQLVDQLHLWGAIEAGRSPRTSGTKPLADVVRAAIEDLQPRAELSGCSIRLTIEDPTTPQVDEPRFPQLIALVAATALQNTPRGEAVEVSIGRTGATHRVVVRDGGPAVPPDLRELMLTRAGQLAVKKRADGRYGRGLALYIAAELARLMGLELSAIDDCGKNAFVVSGIRSGTS